MNARELERMEYSLRCLTQLARAVSSNNGSETAGAEATGVEATNVEMSNTVMLQNVSRNVLRDTSQRVVASCFDLYLLHMGLARYNDMPNAWPVLPDRLKKTLKQMGAPAPLPGTSMCGSTANPFFVVRLREPPNPFSRQASELEDKERELDENIVSGGQFNVKKASARRQQCDVLERQLIASKNHLEIMKEVSATRSTDENNNNSNTKSSTRRVASSPRSSPAKTPTADQLRSAVGTQSPLHSLMLGKFSPLRLNNSRSTML